MTLPSFVASTPLAWWIAPESDGMETAVPEPPLLIVTSGDWIWIIPGVMVMLDEPAFRLIASPSRLIAAVAFASTFPACAPRTMFPAVDRATMLSAALSTIPALVACTSLPVELLTQSAAIFWW